MKNNPNSLINKFADIHSELVKLNKRLSNLENIQEKTNDEFKSEIKHRQNIETKSYQQGELLNGKIFAIRKGLEDISNSLNDKLDNFKEYNDNCLKSNNNSLVKSLQDKLSKIEVLENKTKEIDKEMTNNNEENNKRFTKSIDYLNDQVRELKNEFNKQSSAVEVIERRLSDFYNNLTEDIRDLIKQVTGMKNDIEVLKSFKENSLINFRDISNQFIQK
jgi:predicted  nucleic acid-binding Zn-ribbon protein